MTRNCFLATSALLMLGASSSAQSALAPQKITAPIKHRGTFSLVTGTWSRADPSDSFNSDMLYNNTAATGYFFATAAVFNTIDHGRIPSSTSPTTATSVTGTRRSYEVDCFQIAYCSNIPATAGGVSVTTVFYDEYGPCTDIDLVSAPAAEASFVSTGLPGGTPTSTQGCWVMSFDLAGTTDTFVLSGDANGGWDNQANIDSFGWAQTFPQSSAANAGTGPLIAGNCPWGGVTGNPTSPQQGFGTVFGGVPGANNATGLGTNDFFWIDSNYVIQNANGGCFFFGGCNFYAGAQRNPYSSFWLRLFGDSIPTSPDGPFCDSLPNATGSAALLTAQYTDASVDLVFTSSPVPNTTGQFFYGPMALGGASSLGDGLRCVGGSTTRMLPFINAGMMMQLPNTATLAVNYTAPYASGLVGRKYFQHWFRSGVATGTGSNSSTGYTIEF